MALQQHIRDSPVHTSSSTPDNSDRSINTEQSLQQHLKKSPANVQPNNCKTCNRSFGSKSALEQHMRDSLVHEQAPETPLQESPHSLKQCLQKSTSPAQPYNCKTCNRIFGSKSALKQHTRDSLDHKQAPKPPLEVRSQPLQQQSKNSAAHAPSFDCKNCSRTFRSEAALEHHIRDSPTHQQAPETPLDKFFRSFHGFEYDPSLPPSTSFSYLRNHEGWRRGQAASEDAWNRYQEALEGELRMWYGEESDLTSWHALCRAIGIEPLPQTCEQCEKAVRSTHVNIIDLIEWGRRRGDTDEKVRTFRNLDALRVYTTETGKIFRNRFDEEDGNVVLRHLLRKIFTL
ncbi:uncharacterized protein K460DRAFT_406657 [Cucurbitaria berberidis CBS 394.84]|uniref:C2H2-type domain-containing protein n=1 Tax=Cucurbitaria berberidis CBS 394.84 TaxID=1168544 RepID=A0A9P4L9Q4_9PLEO|nr:uncharacterized protein K460DRAFT_406657 [Cucurbitaria berberidis CBS 394.84]KAF1846454.1 hypothetical protein K460DRAFT_406657 [Cucurbitaria berberidis CBS 394.84]